MPTLRRLNPFFMDLFILQIIHFYLGCRSGGGTGRIHTDVMFVWGKWGIAVQGDLPTGIAVLGGTGIE